VCVHSFVCGVACMCVCVHVHWFAHTRVCAVLLYMVCNNTACINSNTLDEYHKFRTQGN
jgi:hypothetical protein